MQVPQSFSPAVIQWCQMRQRTVGHAGHRAYFDRITSQHFAQIIVFTDVKHGLLRHFCQIIGKFVADIAQPELHVSRIDMLLLIRRDPLLQALITDRQFAIE